MLTLNNILREIKNVPINRLEELYQLVHSFTPKSKQNTSMHKKILSFGGAFSDMTDNDYNAYIEHTKETRSALFNRNVEI